MTTKATRLEILKGSLVKKQQRVDAAFDRHFADVKSANGQPLNDKRNGRATTDRWDAQSDAIRSRLQDVQKTERAIEREQEKVDNVQEASEQLPQYVVDMVSSGELTQWRAHPNTFFVPGVDKGRIVVDLETGAIGVRYLSDVSKDEYPLFRDVVNRLLAAQRERGSKIGSKSRPRRRR